MKKPVYVTKPSLAPVSEFKKYLDLIWESGEMTHNGPLVQQLEKELQEYLNVKHVICVVNGTSAIQLAIQALNLEGEIITTPFTFIATANIISWEKCKPVFVDIDPDTWNIDVNKIEDKINDNTSAILPVHVFSAPCEVEKIGSIAIKYGLKVIYDAAHAMTVERKGRSILKYGDISAVSFHATKLFNTCEGGACVTQNTVLAERLKRMRFFGFDGNKNIVDRGLNAKMTEISAGLGLANLKYLDQVRENRKKKYLLYQKELCQLPFISFQIYLFDEYNFSYIPILFDNKEITMSVIKMLNANQIFPRRYFNPSLNLLKIFDRDICLPVSERVSESILCLPLYDDLEEKMILKICKIIRDVN